MTANLTAQRTVWKPQWLLFPFVIVIFLVLGYLTIIVSIHLVVVDRLLMVVSPCVVPLHLDLSS